MVATVGGEVDLHAPMGRRELVTSLDVADAQQATGARSFQILFGPHNGSTRATLFAGFIPPGKSPWHYHLYDEIVLVPDGPGRLHLAEGDEELRAGAAFRLRPRQVHIVENESGRSRNDDHRNLHSRRKPVRRVPHVRRGCRVPLRRLARAALDPAHVERAASTACPRDGRLGRSSDRHGRATGASRSDSGGARRRRRVRRRRRATRGRRPPRRARSRASSSFSGRPGSTGPRPGSRTTRGRATSSATSSPRRACSADSSHAFRSHCPPARARGASTR